MQCPAVGRRSGRQWRIQGLGWLVWLQSPLRQARSWKSQLGK